MSEYDFEKEMFENMNTDERLEEVIHWIVEDCWEELSKQSKARAIRQLGFMGYPTDDLKTYMNDKQENKLQQTTTLLEFIGYEFGCVIDELEKCSSIGSTYSDEEVAYRYKNDLWKNEWLDEYRDNKGDLTEMFFEDVNESKDFICCDSCKKWGYFNFNYIFEGDFYCDLCHIKDTLKDFDKAIKILKENEDEI